VAQVGASPDDDELFHILYDGTVMDEEGFTVLGGQSDTIAEALGSEYQPTLDRAAAIRLGAKVLAGADQPALEAGALEVAFLDRARERRAFQRLRGADLESVLAS
jgi:proteasome alpha subunit